MKKIFLVISKDIIRRNIYDTDFWSEFCNQTKGVIKVLIVPQADVLSYKEKFSGGEVIVEGYTTTPWRGWGKFVMFLVRNGLCSHSTKTYRWRTYSLGHAPLVATLFKEVMATTLGRIALFKKLVRFLVGTLPNSAEIKNLFEKYKPVAVFAPSLIDNEFDVPIAICARKNNIPVIGMVRSWDNLNNHGLLAFLPDTFILQNKWLTEAAKKYQGITKDFSGKIVGLPHYDLYKEPATIILPKEEFFAKLGLDINKKLILLGGSDFYYSEDVLPTEIDKAIIEGAFHEKIQVVFRPHPKSTFGIEEYKLDELENIVLDNAFSSKTLFTDTEKFINLLYYADVIINICSTLSIDAAVFNKPAICINFDDTTKKLSYYQQVHRLYDSFDHYERLVQTGGVRLPRSISQLVVDINEYLEDPNLDSDGRKRIIEEFVAPFDGQSGKRLANIVARSCHVS